MNLAVWAEPYGVARAPACCWFRAALLPVPAPGSGSPGAGCDRGSDLDVGSAVRRGGRWEPRVKHALAVGAATQERGAP